VRAAGPAGSLPSRRLPLTGGRFRARARRTLAVRNSPTVSSDTTAMSTPRPRSVARLAAASLLTIACQAPDEASETLDQGLGAHERVPGLVMGLRHNLTQADGSTVMPSGTGDAVGPIRGGDLGAPNHRGYEWWVVPDRADADPAALRLPPGVVVALKHNVNQRFAGITAFGRDPVSGPASFPGFVRQAGGDLTADRGSGYFWYESTGDGFTDWDSTANLPSMTVVGLKHVLNQPHKSFVWNGLHFDAGKDGPAPEGFVRRCGGDIERGTLRNGFCWYERAGGEPGYTGASIPSLEINLGRPIFVPPGSEGDADGDGLDDTLENLMALVSAPVFRFDSDEEDRRPNEPVTLFRVFPNPTEPGQLKIRWVFLYANDGGYGPWPAYCPFDSHPGDNDTATWDLGPTSEDGSSWQITRVRLGLNINNAAMSWPGSSRLEVRGRAHPVIYMSAGKHHEYFTRDNDENDSFYSGSGCNDRVNGQGPELPANLRFADRFTNVGEPNGRLIDGLGDIDPAFARESAWGTNPFLGPDASANHRQFTQP
jgi:hypothetical protein